MAIYAWGKRIMNKSARSSVAGLLALGLVAQPLAHAAPAPRPQVVIAIGNSESMDGDLTGAIMVGSGKLPPALQSLDQSSSPVNYTVPKGFVPPLTGASGPTAPYTVEKDGAQFDNSASRLNIAKAGIGAVLKQYLSSIDFALIDYDAKDTGAYNTWVYQMAPQNGNFTFSKTAPAQGRSVANPCYQYQASTTTTGLHDNCASIATGFSGDGATMLNDNPFMAIGASSDDVDINDVLYFRGDIPGVFDNFGEPDPANPYPPNFTLKQYNDNNVGVAYHASNPRGYALKLMPTNAGYIPHAPHAMFVQRGFGYNVAPKPDRGNTVVALTQGDGAAALPAFEAALMPETNDPKDTRTNEIKASAVQSPLGGLMAWAHTLLGKSNGACPGQYVILVTDGLPTEDLKGKFWPPLGSAAGQGYAVHAGFAGLAGDANHGIIDESGKASTEPTGALVAADTNDQALLDTITKIQELAQAGIKTYVVGLGAGVDRSANPAAYAALNAMAIAGMTGHEYPAADAPAFDAAVKEIAAQVSRCMAPPPPLALKSVYFPYDRYDILPDYRHNARVIEAQLHYLQANPQTHVVLQGNCDARGSGEYNLALGQKRAEIVMQDLEKSGIDASRMEAVSFGKEHPRASGTSDAAYAENRRTDFVYPSESEAATPQGIPLN